MNIKIMRLKRWRMQLFPIVGGDRWLNECKNSEPKEKDP